MLMGLAYRELIGQIMGVVCVILGFVTFQVKTAKRVLWVQTFTCISFCIHYVLIGAMSAFAMNAVAVLRNLVYLNRDKKILSADIFPYLFTVLMAVIGILSWQGAYSVFVFLGLVINTFCMSFKNPQNIRKSILITSPLVLIYDLFVASFGGVIFESVSVVSAIIGIVRNRRNQK